jgi:hypothetical protein
MSITTAEKSVRIPTFSLGVEYSEQATKYVNLDLICSGNRPSGGQ